jgi:hypothetical protein
MRIIHSRIKLYWKPTEEEKDQEIVHHIKDSDLAFWYNNLARFKKAGHTTVLYTQTEYLPTIKAYGLDKYYDEIETETLDAAEEDINLDRFWAAPKLISYLAEINKGNQDVMVTDTDLFLLKTIEELTEGKDVLLWNSQEFQEFKKYASIEYLPYPEGFQWPEWFKDGSVERNTGVIWFKDPTIAKEWLEVSLNYMRKNPETSGGLDLKNHQMVFAEQKTIGMFLTNAHPKLTVGYVQEYYERQFNKKGWHYCMYKGAGEEFFFPYIVYLFEMLEKVDPTMLEDVKQIEQFKPIFEHVAKVGKRMTVPQLVRERNLYL